MPEGSERQLHKRTMLGICAEVLTVLQHESVPSKTRLAQKCKLDTKTTKYIDLMLGTGLIEQFERSNHLRVSDKGKEFLKSYGRLMNFLNQDQLLDPKSSV
jgi:predicted transcriptional regulator